MSHKVLAVACFFVGSLSLVACSGTGDDDNSQASAVNANEAPAPEGTTDPGTNAQAPACYQPKAVPLSYQTVNFPAASAACQQADLQGFFQACYTQAATRETCAAWQQSAAGAANCRACVRSFSVERPDASGQPSGLPAPATNACVGTQLGTCANDVVKFSQCAGSVCSTCTTAGDLSGCQAAAAPGACNELQAPSTACFQAHQTDLAACIPPSAAQLQANPQLGGQYLVRFYVGACVDHNAWVPAAPAAPATP